MVKIAQVRLNPFELLKGQSRVSQLQIALIGLIIGFLLVTQFRGQQSASHALRAQTDEDLSEIIRNLNVETNALRAEAASLELQLFKARQAAVDARTVLGDATERLRSLEVLAGSTAVGGGGIEMTITDGDHLLRESDLVDVLHELRAAGAEAMSLNGYRLVASSGLRYEKGRSGGGAILLGSRRISAPYEIKAIGDRETLYQAIVMPGGARDALSSLEGVSFYVTKEEHLVLAPVAAAEETRPADSLGR